VSIGEGLAQARREAGLSLAQVSQRTRIRERIIADIESDDYSACGGDFYARGHIRSIARAIGTDPDPFIRDYDAAQPEPDDVAEAEITQPGMAIGIQPGIPLLTEPGQPGPAEPGWSEPAEPGWPTAAEPGWSEAEEPGWSEPEDPGRSAAAEPGWSEPEEPGWSEPEDPGWSAAAEPGWSEPADPGWSAAAEAGWSEPGEPGRTARTETARTPHTDPGFPFFGESAAAVGARSAAPDGPRLPPPPVPPGDPRRHSLPPPPAPPGRTRRRHPLNWAALLALALLAGLGYLAYHLFAGSSRATASSAHSAPARPPASQSAAQSSPPPTPTSTPSPSPKPPPRTRPLAPAGAQALGFSGPGDDPANAHLAIDGNPGTAWRTDWYTSAAFGNLYPGTGLLVNMGRPVTITGARIRFGPARGGSFQLRVGGRPSLSALRPVAHGIPAGVARVRLSSPAHGRYVLIWFTSLPVDPSGSWRASVYDLRLQGR
jgi:transcriptional regulator with XRE-family HTH domain